MLDNQPAKEFNRISCIIAWIVVVAVIFIILTAYGCTRVYVQNPPCINVCGNENKIKTKQEIKGSIPTVTTTAKIPVSAIP